MSSSKIRRASRRRAVYKTGDFLLFGVIFVPLVVLGLSKAVRHREYRYLWVQIPLYVAALALEILAVSGVKYASVSKLLDGLFSMIIK